MGKAKETKANNVKKNIFKVAGCKSLKVKNKAKAVTNERIKSVHVKNRQKIENIDKQLSALNTEVRQSKKPEQKSNLKLGTLSDKRTAKIIEEVQRYNESKKNCEEALERLSSFDMR